MISEEQLNRLDLILEKTHRLSVEGIDGLFSAAIVGPGEVMPSECLELIDFEDSVPWESREQAEEVHSLLLELWNTVAERICRPPDDLFDALPFIAFPENFSDEHIVDGTFDDFLLAGEWAQSFLEIVRLRIDAWVTWIESDEELASFISTLVALNSEAKDRDEDIPELNFKQRLELFDFFPQMLQELNQRRLDELHPGTIRRGVKIGRNDPCPCGSGKKLKKCCG
jgi:uncharacterized protein